MTASVTSLASRRPDPTPPCTCVQHRLWDLSDRLRRSLNRTAGQLLIDRADHAQVLEDALATIAAAVATREQAIR